MPPVVLASCLGIITSPYLCRSASGYTFRRRIGVAGHDFIFKRRQLSLTMKIPCSTVLTYSKTNARNNTAMLDTWLSGGAGCAANFVYMKTEDGTAGGTTVVNANGILANNDPNAGIPLTTQDGLYQITRVHPSSVTLLGFTANELATLDNTSNAGGLVPTTNASWAVLGGASGSYNGE